MLRRPNTSRQPAPFTFSSFDRQPKLEQEYWWDLAKVTSRDYELEQLQLKSRAETFKIIFKLFAYIVFFVLVLCSSVVNKLSLFAMVNAYKITNQVNNIRTDALPSLLSALFQTRLSRTASIGIWYWCLARACRISYRSCPACSAFSLIRHKAFRIFCFLSP